MPLLHDSPECTGRWGVRQLAGKSVWKCDGCGELGAITLQNHASAIRENLMGNTLDQLTSDGRELLDRP